MSTTPSDLQDKSIRERNNQLAEWFAEGLLDDDVLDRAQQAGYDLSIEGVADKRVELYERINRALAKLGPKRFQHIARSHQSVRIRELDLLADSLRAGVKWCVDKQHYATLPKLSDSLMRCLRLIAEEVHDLEPQSRGMNVWLTMIESVPRQERNQMMSKMQELQSMLDAKQLLGLPRGEDPGIIDGSTVR